MNETNRIIAEWMGLCWHDVGPHMVHGDDFADLPCLKCGEQVECFLSVVSLDADIRENTNYTSSLDAVSKAEAKAVEVYGDREYCAALITALHAAQWKPEREVHTMHYALASAEIRAAAIRKLIEENA